MDGEVWKDVVGFEGLYMVSNMGRIKALASIRKFGNFTRRHRERIMKLFPNWAGYLHCRVADLNQKQTGIRVHQCVANAFIPKPNGAQCINHKDENKQNNVVSNLEWCTFAYNLRYGSRRLQQCVPIVKCDLSGNPIAEYESIQQASNDNNIKRTCISNCLNGWSQRAGGFVWKFKQ